MLPLLLRGVIFSFLSSVFAANSGSYAPNTQVSCPSSPIDLLRVIPPINQTLHPQEQEYISQRARTVPQAWQAWLGDGSAAGYDISLLRSHLPRVSIAISGGGERASLFGASVLQALDGRNATSVAAKTGGIFQLALYQAGNSGSSWLIGSSLFNGFPSFNELVLGSSDESREGWLLDLDLVIPDGINIFSKNNQYFFGRILSDVYEKARAGSDTSITDPWSRAISYHYLPGTTRTNFFSNDSAHGAGQLWSDIPTLPVYQSHSVPFPLVAINSRVPKSNWSTWVTLDSPVYEVTPFEMGSWDPSLSAMTSTKFLGSRLNNGQSVNGSSCVTGFDQAGYVLGTSSNLFNILFDNARNTLAGFNFAPAAGIIWLLRQLVNNVIVRADDVATWPNPFLGLNSGSFRDSSVSWLELLDGGTNRENIPFSSLFLKARQQEVVLAIDGSADTDNNWPNGTSLLVTSERLRTILNTTHQQFPPIPSSVDDFLDTGVTLRPTFFGCNPTQQPPEWPLVVYLPNAPPLSGEAPVTNTDSFKTSYTRLFQETFLRQGFNASLNGFTPDSPLPDAEFGNCLQCALLDRARLKASPLTPRSDICSRCFGRYCFDPANPPSKAQIVGRTFRFVDPDPQGLDAALSFVQKNRVAFIIGGSIVGVLLVGAIVGCCLRHRRRVVHERAYRQLKEEAAGSWNAGRHSYEMGRR